MSKPRAPAPPDYRGAAEEQGRSSIEAINTQTEANRPNQTTPWGSSQWTQGPDGQWSQNITLNPNEQASLESQQRLGLSKSQLGESLTGRMSSEFGSQMDWNQFGDFGDVPEAGRYDSGQDYLNKAGDALYGRATSRLDPQWEQRAEQTEVKLRNQGLRPGDQAYDRAMDNMERQRTDAYQQAGYGADIGAGSEAARLSGMDLSLGGQRFGEELQSSNLQTTQRQQKLVEEMQKRGFSLNEMNAIISGQQVGLPQMPGFQAAGAAQPTDYLGAANMGWNADLDRFGVQSAQNSALMGNIGSVAGAAMMFSDRRLKTDIVPLGDGWYSYKLFGHIPQIGVMADEQPQAVVPHWSGFDMVNYGNL